MPALFRVDVVLSFSEPVTLVEVEALQADLQLPSAPVLATGEGDPQADTVRLDDDGEGADLVVLVEAETTEGAQEQTEAAVRAALERSSWSPEGARMELTRATEAYGSA